MRAHFGASSVTRMNITEVVIVNVVLDVVVLGGVGYAMTHTRRLRPHQPRDIEASAFLVAGPPATEHSTASANRAGNAQAAKSTGATSRIPFASPSEYEQPSEPARDAATL